MKHNLKKISKAIWFPFLVILVIGGVILDSQITNAAWETPTGQPPDSNIFVPLNIGPDNQAKEGNLLLDPLYNSMSISPTVDYPLEVRGPNNIYIKDFEVLPEGDLIVDLDTLYVDGNNKQVGVGILSLTSDAKLEIGGGEFNIGQLGAGVDGIGLSVSSTANEEVIYGSSTAINQASIYGLGIDDSIGVYGNNVSSGYGIYAESDNTSAVVGATSSEYSMADPKISGIYGSATGLGSWAGYFEQRLYGSDDIVGRKFLPNRLQNSQIPYTAGWKVRDIDESELISVNVMTFDGEYIYAVGGHWETDHILIIDPDTMGIVDKVMLGPEGEHSLIDVIDGGGYIWVAHNHNYGDNGQAAVTRIDPADVHNFQTTYIYPNAGGSGNNDSDSVKLLYDDKTLGGPYIWALNKLNYDPVHSITQMDMNGNVITTFSIDELANGGNKCSRYNNYLYNDINHCNDGLDNDNDGLIDNGVCEYTAPVNETECVTAGGTWVEACTDRTFDNKTDCETASAVWAETCSNSSCIDSDECTLCDGTGTWDVDLEICSETECNSQDTCEGTVTCNGTWTNGDNQCLADAPLGVCDAGTCSNDSSNPGVVCTEFGGECLGGGTCEIPSIWGECINNSANWTWNTASGPANIDERIVDAYIGVPSGLTQDGDGNIWVTFRGSPDWDYRDIFSGEGYAKFNASDPELASDQYVYCSGPETSPSGIAYDEINDQMWIPYSTSTMNENRGISKVDVSNGQVTEWLPYPTWPIGDRIKYFRESPGGPSIWIINDYYNFSKINPDTNVVENTRNIHGADFDFDVRDAANPQILMTTSIAAVVFKHTMEAPYTTSTNVILGAISEKLLFDGTNIWSSNYGTNSITKYSAKDAIRLGVYDIGASADQMIFDGKAIWVPFYDDSITKYKRLDISNGNIDEYELTPDLGNTTYTQDVVYDGKNIWQSVFSVNQESMIIKVDLSSCNSGTKQCSSGEVYDFTDLTDGPEHLIFDGEYIWSFNRYKNKVYKFSTDPITMEAEIILSEISNIPDVDWHYERMNAVEYDGTNIWVGAYHTDGDGNSIYKFNPEGVNNDGDLGVCSNDNEITCNLSTDCGAGNVCNVVVSGKYPVFHMPGKCTSSEDSCMKDTDCGGLETCDGIWTRVTSLTFDGINMWATHEGFGEHDSTGNECKDKLDNDGNGQCDYDGAVGYPGCSGKPDPGCADPETDTLEITGRNSQYEGSNKVLTRIVVATDEIVESVSVNPIFYSSTFVNDAVFDGQNIWLGGKYFKKNTLVQFYSGSGAGNTNFSNTVRLHSTLLTTTTQSGNFSISGNASFGNNLIIANDFVASGNLWGGSVDNERDFGVGCDDGNFVKGIDNNLSNLHCRSL